MVIDPPQESGARRGVSPSLRGRHSLVHGVQMSLKWLEANAASIDRLNVFPVPDGDTGTNMVLTLRAALEEARGVNTDHVGELSGALARGALMGARGNSGVILSQIIRGLSEGFEGTGNFGPDEFAHALERAYQAAYESVTDPVEGTILTVARDAASAADRVRSTVCSVEDMVAEVVRDVHESVQRTPDQLPVLKEAGVVDAGGQGLHTILEGLLYYLRGDELPDVSTEDRASEVFAGFAEAHKFDEHGYCTEFLVRGEEMEIANLRRDMGALGGSLLVVGDSELARVHVHTDRPDRAMGIALSYGQLDAIKVDNMDLQQAVRFQSAYSEAGGELPVTPASGLVAVVAGEGIEKVMRSLGAVVVRGGQTMNPSSVEILRAIDAAPDDWAIVLPNNSNIVMASRQAAEQSSKNVHVVASRTVPEGVSAILAFNPAADVDTNVAAMEVACSQVQTIEVTTAVRDVRLGDLSVMKGQYIGLLDGDLVAGSDDPDTLVLDLIGRARICSSEVVTVYAGCATRAEQVDTLVGEIGRRFPNLEVEMVAGGQELYDYIVSVE